VLPLKEYMAAPYTQWLPGEQLGLKKQWLVRDLDFESLLSCKVGETQTVSLLYDYDPSWIFKFYP